MKALILIICLALAGCVHTPTLVKDESSNNYQKVARVGILLNKDDGKVKYVEKVLPKSPAENAGITEGDMIIALDGNTIDSRSKMRILLGRSVRTNNPVEILTERNGKQSKIILQPTIMEVQQTLLKILDLVDGESKANITIAVLVGEITNSLPTGGYNIADWKKGISQSLASKAEQSILSLASSVSGLKLVDRSITKRIVEEFEFGHSGLVNPELMVKLGKMFGVTHIILCEFSRFAEGNRGFIDENRRKLIDIQTGAILASDFEKFVMR